MDYDGDYYDFESERKAFERSTIQKDYGCLNFYEDRRADLEPLELFIKKVTMIVLGRSEEVRNKILENPQTLNYICYYVQKLPDIEYKNPLAFVLACTSINDDATVDQQKFKKSITLSKTTFKGEGCGPEDIIKYVTLLKRLKI